MSATADIYKSQTAGTKRNREANRFILALVFSVLALIAASVILPPVTSGSGHANGVWLVGP